MDHAAETMALADLQILPGEISFDEAVRYMASKVPLTRKEYKELDNKLRFRAFTASRLAQIDSIEKVRKHLVKSIANGRTLSEFQTQAGIEEALQVSGFSEESPWYWETVYRTNMQTAYTTGRLMQYEKNPPLFLEFIGIDDNRQTGICRARSGTILPYTDSWWNKNYPPLHFNCRSTVRAIYKEEAEIRGIESTGVPEADNPDNGFGENPLKSGNYYELTDSMKERAIQYGIDTEFLAAAVDADLPDYARMLVKAGFTADKILFPNIKDSRLRALAEESVNPEIPLRTEGRELIEKYKDDVKFEISNSGSMFIPGPGRLLISKSSFKESRRFITFRHEFGHALDHRISKKALSSEKEFTDIIKKINRKLAGSNYDEKLRDDVVQFITEHYDDPSVSDLFCSITGRKDSALHGIYVHSAAYYRNYEKRAGECFANLFDLYCMNDGRWQFLKNNLPELTDGFEKLIKQLGE